MMRNVLATFAWAAALAAMPALAQQPQRVFRVGMVWNSLPQADLDRRATVHPGPRLIEQGLQKLGWVPGKDVILLSRSAESRYERFPALVDQLIRVPVDVLVVFGPEAGKVARGRTKTIPIVFAGLANLRTDSEPTGNVTGVTTSNPVGKRLELLKAIAPKASRVAMFASVSAGQAKPSLSTPLIEGARRIGFELFAVYFEGPHGLEAAFEDAVRGRADALYMSTFPELTWAAEVQDTVLRLAQQHRMPAVYEAPGMAAKGGLIAFGHGDFDDYRRAAYFIDRILRGAQPATLPLEEPMKFEVNINRRTAGQLGLRIPPSLLVQADNIYD
jgi:putative ABC transport system substrate-binding protein